VPWKENSVLEQRVAFIRACQANGGDFMTDLCDRFEISRKTGYKWLARYHDADGIDGLRDQSRAPQTHPNAVSPEIEDAVVAMKLAHIKWGAKKVKACLRRADPQMDWPAASTMETILKRNGLVVPRPPTRRTPPYTQPFAGCLAPNDVWCADFKGWFRTLDGRRCDPFTLTDAYSRFLLRCQIVPRPNRRWVQAICDAAFREYGLPRAIRTDNGPPFAARAVGGLSLLAIHWIKLGIIPERIRPGRPQQNARHERMHRTLNGESASPPQDNRRKQQTALGHFRQEFNYERPHEALDQNTPASLYERSPRPYPRRLPPIVYPDGFVVQRVRKSGQLSWHGHDLFLSKRLAGELVGLQQQEDDTWIIHFGPLPLVIWNPRTGRIKPYPRRQQSC